MSLPLNIYPKYLAQFTIAVSSGDDDLYIIFGKEFWSVITLWQIDNVKKNKFIVEKLDDSLLLKSLSNSKLLKLKFVTTP